MPVRSHSNPGRTMANKVGALAIFLREYGHKPRNMGGELPKKSEYPKYHKKIVIASMAQPTPRRLSSWTSSSAADGHDLDPVRQASQDPHG